jgi:hypothetical protein
MERSSKPLTCLAAGPIATSLLSPVIPLFKHRLAMKRNIHIVNQSLLPYHRFGKLGISLRNRTSKKI